MAFERIDGQLDPSTPEEYFEAILRFTEILAEKWEEFPDGDGKRESQDDDNQTKTDMFALVCGCADAALDCLALKSEVNKIG